VSCIILDRKLDLMVYFTRLYECVSFILCIFPEFIIIYKLAFFVLSGFDDALMTAGNVVCSEEIYCYGWRNGAVLTIMYCL
jgi:hypothetical protein